MRLTVLGATGLTGMEIIKQGLADGHEITAVVRSAAKLGEFQSKVRIVVGDSTDPKIIDQAVVGANAVLSALGHLRDSPPDLLSKSATNLISSMKTHEIKRLVVLSNSVVKDPNDSPKLYHRFLKLLLTVIKNRLCQDTISEAKIISESGLEWTIVRAVILTNRPASGMYHVGMLDHSASTGVSRADVANFMISCAIGAKYVQARPLIG